MYLAKALLLSFASADVFIPDHPLQVEEKERTYNILTVSLICGSMKKVMDETAIDFSKSKWPSGKPMFNVSMLTSKQSNKKILGKASKTFHPIEMDFDPESYLPASGIKPAMLKVHENSIVDQLIYM